jgi:hypothetical protein
MQTTRLQFRHWSFFLASVATVLYSSLMIVAFPAEKPLTLVVKKDGSATLVYDHAQVDFVQTIVGTIDCGGSKAKVRWSASFVYPSHARVNEEVLSALKQAGFDIDVMVLTDN